MSEVILRDYIRIPSAEIFAGVVRESKLTQSEMGVPSSANWNPTKPLTRSDQYKAVIRPNWTAANHFCALGQCIDSYSNN